MYLTGERAWPRGINISISPASSVSILDPARSGRCTVAGVSPNLLDWSLWAELILGMRAHGLSLAKGS
jgi:hypothetical protein